MFDNKKRPDDTPDGIDPVMRGDPNTPEPRQRARPSMPRLAFRVLVLVMSLAVAAFAVTPLAAALWNSFGSPPAGHMVEDSGLTSWNPNVACAADLVTIRDVLGPAYPSQTVNGSRYQTNSTAGGIPQERALSPPCTITNMTGQATSSFVQINGVSLYGYGVKTTDCSQWYSKQNGGGRYPGNHTVCTNGGQVITIGTTSGYLRIEIDRDWLGKGYCGVGVPFCDNATLAQQQSNGSISLDVQGFVFWEGPWHWEIHPFTAWRLSSSVTPPSAPQNLEAVAGDANVGLSWQAPASDGGSPITNYQIYRGTTAGGATFLATVGDVLTYSDTNVTNGQSYFYQVTARNAAGESPRSNEVSATPNPPPPPPDFDISASPNTLTIHIGSSGTSTITLTSVGGFSGDVSLSASVACASPVCLVYPTAGVNPDVVTVVSGGTATSTLTVSAGVLTTLGTYEVTVTATSGSLAHTVTITVYVTL